MQINPEYMSVQFRVDLNYENRCWIDKNHWNVKSSFNSRRWSTHPNMYFWSEKKKIALWLPRMITVNWIKVLCQLTMTYLLGIDVLIFQIVFMDWSRPENDDIEWYTRGRSWIISESWCKNIKDIQKHILIY